MFNNKGFTLVEAVIALVILSIIVTPVFFLFYQSNRTMGKVNLESRISEGLTHVIGDIKKMLNSENGIDFFDIYVREYKRVYYAIEYDKTVDEELNYTGKELFIIRFTGALTGINKPGENIGVISPGFKSCKYPSKNHYGDSYFNLVINNNTYSYEIYQGAEGKKLIAVKDKEFEEPERDVLIVIISKVPEGCLNTLKVNVTNKSARDYLIKVYSYGEDNVVFTEQDKIEYNRITNDGDIHLYRVSVYIYKNRSDYYKNNLYTKRIYFLLGR